MTRFRYLIVWLIILSRKISWVRERRKCVYGFQKSVKDCKIWDRKDKKIILNRNVTFDEVSMLKPADSQHVESEKTNMISQKVESNVTPSSPDRSVSFEITPKVT